jgi:hypothetical protein
MPGKTPGPEVKDQQTRDALRDAGASKDKAARIANARAGPPMTPSRKGGRSGPYEGWNKDDLYRRAREIGIAGRSEMTKAQLIEALRNL